MTTDVHPAAAPIDGEARGGSWIARRYRGYHGFHAACWCQLHATSFAASCRQHLIEPCTQVSSGVEEGT
jgi:hypothetical protein